MYTGPVLPEWIINYIHYVVFYIIFYNKRRQAQTLASNTFIATHYIRRNWLSFTAAWFFWWSPQLLSELPTLSSVGTPLSPAGTGDHRSWDVRRRPRSRLGPCRTGHSVWPISPGQTSCFLSTPKSGRQSLAGQTASACVDLWPETKAVKEMCSIWCTRKKFVYFFHVPFCRVTYVFDDPAGSDTVIEAHPAAVVIVLAWTNDILVAHEVVTLVQNPPAAFYLDRVASEDVAM